MSGTTSGEVSTDAVQNIDVVQFQHWLTGYEVGKFRARGTPSKV